MRRAKKKNYLAIVVLSTALFASASIHSKAQADDCPVNAEARSGSETERSVGPVTNFPMPRYVSMKAKEANIRVGPSVTYRVLRTYVVRGVPLKIIDEYEHWRRVQSWDGTVGWIHKNLLTGIRKVIVMENHAPMRMAPESDSWTKAKAEQGVVGDLGKCTASWCLVSVGDFDGWMMKSCLWGIDPDEILD